MADNNMSRPNLAIDPTADTFDLPSQTIKVTDITQLGIVDKYKTPVSPVGTIPIIQVGPKGKRPVSVELPTRNYQSNISLPVPGNKPMDRPYLSTTPIGDTPGPLSQVNIPITDPTQLEIRDKWGNPITPLGTIPASKEMRGVSVGLPSKSKMQWPEPPLPESTRPPEIHRMGMRTYTGADITCVVHILGNAGKEPFIIANAQTLSYSIHREKYPVRALGHTYPVGHTRGSRTIAGSIIFTMLDREVLWELVQAYAVDVEWTDADQKYSTYSPMLDQLPPFDITITFANEYGDISNMAIYGVELVDEGTVLSIDDLLVEKTCSWVARDIDMMRPYDYGNRDMMSKDRSMEVVSNADITAYLNTLRARRNKLSGSTEKGIDDVYLYDIPYDAAIFQATANQDVKSPGLGTNDPVTYTSEAGVIWEGTVSVQEVGTGQYNYLFIPDTGVAIGNKVVPLASTIANINSTQFVHKDALDNGTIPTNIEPKYIYISGPVSRDSLRKR